MNTNTIIYNTKDSEGIMKYIGSIKDDFKIIVKRNPNIDGRLNCGAGWDVCLKTNSKAYRTQFNNSKINGTDVPKADSILDCILSDVFSYLAIDGFYEFCREFGYASEYDNPEIKKIARKSYEGCKKATERMLTMFTEEELSSIQDKLWYPEENN